MIHTTIAIASTARIDPTTIGRIGTPEPLLGRTALRAVLPLREPAPAWALDLGAIERLVEYRRPFWPRPKARALSFDRGLKPKGRRFPLRDYEVLYIVRADLDDDKVQDAVKRVNTLIARSGGTVERTNLWGKRKLAYEVKHQKEGSYVLQDFQLAPERVPELEASLKITEEVLRHLIVRKPEKAAPVTAVAPPPAEVVLEPVTADSQNAAGVRQADREEET